MIPGSYPLVLYRGDSARWRFVLWADAAKTMPADLTGVVPKSEIRDAPGGKKVVSLVCALELPNAIGVVLTAASSALLPATGAWDLQLTYQSGEIATVLAGAVTVTADVTDSGFQAARGGPVSNVAEPPTLVIDIQVWTPVVIAVDVVEFGGPPLGYPDMPFELRQLPISFPFSNKPGSGTTVNVPMGFALTIPAGLAGTRTYAQTKPTASTTFTLNRVSAGVVTLLGTITLTSTSETSCALSGPGGPLAAGEVLQIVAGAQDATAADIGITVMANRV